MCGWKAARTEETTSRPNVRFRPIAVISGECESAAVANIDPSPLGDLQEAELESRYRLAEPTAVDEKPETLAQVHWRIQPKWLRIATLVLVPPLALVWGYMIKSGQALDNEGLMLGIFAIIGTIILSQFFVIARAYWRMDI